MNVILNWWNNPHRGYIIVIFTGNGVKLGIRVMKCGVWWRASCWVSAVFCCYSLIVFLSTKNTVTSEAEQEAHAAFLHKLKVFSSESEKLRFSVEENPTLLPFRMLALKQLDGSSFFSDWFMKADPSCVWARKQVRLQVTSIKLIECEAQSRCGGRCGLPRSRLSAHRSVTELRNTRWGALIHHLRPLLMEEPSVHASGNSRWHEVFLRRRSGAAAAAADRPLLLHQSREER